MRGAPLVSLSTLRREPPLHLSRRSGHVRSPQRTCQERSQNGLLFAVGQWFQVFAPEPGVPQKERTH